MLNRRLKTVLCFLLCLSIILCTSTITWAAEKTNKQQDIQLEIKNEIHHFLQLFLRTENLAEYAQTDIEEAYIGQKFKILDLDYSDLEVDYYPIIIKDNLAGLIAVINDGQNYSVCVSKDFSEQLNLLLKSSSESYCLLTVKEGLYAVDEAATVIPLIDDNSLSEDEIINSLYCLTTFNNDNLKFAVSYESVLEQDISIAAADSSEAMPLDYQFRRLNVPIVSQKANGVVRDICWAACIAALLMYENPTVYHDLTAQGVADGLELPYEPLSTEDVCAYLRFFLINTATPTLIESPLTAAETRFSIENMLEPIHMESVTADRKYGHATVICGYEYADGNNRTNIEMMNPRSESLIWTTHLDGNTQFVSGGKTYYWNRSVRMY